MRLKTREGTKLVVRYYWGAKRQSIQSLDDFWTPEGEVRGLGA